VLHPHIAFRLSHQHALQAMQQQLERGEIDLCITSPPLEQKDIDWQERIGWVPLLSEEMYLVVPLCHPLAGRESIHLSEVAHDPFISLRAGDSLRELTDHFCRQAGFTPRIVFEGTRPRRFAALSALVWECFLFPASCCAVSLISQRCQ
jgi:DNA-binding transcriptional LysR family regulator